MEFRQMVMKILDAKQPKSCIPIFLFLPNKSITVSAGLDLLFAVCAHSAFLVPCLLMYPVTSLLSLFWSWVHDQWSLSQGTLWSLGWEHLFQRYLYSLQSDSWMKVYFKLTFVVQTSGSQKWDKISPQTHISLACYYEVWGVFSPCKQDQRIDAVKLWCWRRLLRVPWTARRSSQSILKEISPEYSLEGVILKLQYFGHLIWRTNSLENTLMLGNIKGRRRRGHCKPLARSPCSAWEWSAV